LGDFQPVSIKMAKEQNLSLNPTKISGTCGRLMCCLKYEQEAYESLIRCTPKVGAYVETAEGRGVVEDANLLTGALKIRLDSEPDAAFKTFSRDDVKVLRDGEQKPDTRPAQKSEHRPDAKTAQKQEPKPEQKAEPKPEPKPEQKHEPKAEEKPAQPEASNDEN
jgi:cell fate regulator YaaT (PSP1 superfamily)